MAAVLETRLRQAQAEAMAPIDLISCLVTDELTRRADRLLEPRRKQAGFRDSDKTLDNLTKHTGVVELQTAIVKVVQGKLSKLEFQIMDALWSRGPSSIRDIQESFPEKRRPAYTTVQTTMYRLEGKGAIARVKKVGNFHIFEAAISRNAAQRRLIDDLLALFGGRTQPVIAHLIESGKFTLDDVKKAEKTLRELERKDKG
ncbi:MAG: BlaI/MecI/CopY family transcriptional regulator [Bryobacteraceae bacterium]